MWLCIILVAAGMCPVLPALLGRLRSKNSRFAHVVAFAALWICLDLSCLTIWAAFLARATPSVVPPLLVTLLPVQAFAGWLSYRIVYQVNELSRGEAVHGP